MAFAGACMLISCSGSKEQEPKTAEERFTIGKKYFDEGNYFDAIQQFDILKLQYQGSKVSDQGQYYTGMSHFKRGEYILAAFDFELLIKNYSSSTLIPDAYYMIAKSYVEQSPQSQLDQSYTMRALDALQTFIELYPTHARVADAQKDQKELIEKLSKKEYDTGVLYEKMEDTKAAMIYYDRVFDQYYNTAYADDALAAKIKLLLRKKRTEDARKSIEIFIKKFPESPYKSEIEKLKSALPAEQGGNSQSKTDSVN